jgi:hypothetical protein
MNFPDALKKLDELEAGAVTEELVEVLAEELRLAGIRAKHEMIAFCRTQGYTPDEIEDGIERIEASIAEMSEEALARLQRKRHDTTQERLH